MAETGIQAIEFLGKSAGAREVRDLIVRMSQADFPILITGEDGTGKELVARLLHDYGERKNEPFVAVDLAAVPPGLAHAELFGHTRGAFTGASSNRPGILASSNGGTLLLDEIDQAPIEIQAALLRALSYGEIHPVGASSARRFDARVISTTSADPDLAIRDGRLRSDLYHRLAVGRIHIPPLRERRDDIAILSEYFLEQANSTSGGAVSIAKDAMKALANYQFPGNARELRNIVTVAAFNAHSSGEGKIRASDLRLRLSKNEESPERSNPAVAKQQADSLQRDLDHLRANTIDASPIWQGRRFPTDPDYCFVLMPFSDEDDVQAVFREHIKPVIEGRCGLRCERADDIYDISGVMQSVWEGINRARLIIADLTRRNSNVFYELGIAHTLGKPVIMLTQSMDFVPFDLRHLRCVVYSYKPNEIESFETALERTVTTILSSEGPIPSQALQRKRI